MAKYDPLYGFLKPFIGGSDHFLCGSAEAGGDVQEGMQTGSDRNGGLSCCYEGRWLSG